MLNDWLLTLLVLVASALALGSGRVAWRALRDLETETVTVHRAINAAMDRHPNARKWVVRRPSANPHYYEVVEQEDAEVAGGSDSPTG